MALYYRRRFSKRPKKERVISDRTYRIIMSIIAAVVITTLYILYKFFIG